MCRGILPTRPWPVQRGFPGPDHNARVLQATHMLARLQQLLCLVLALSSLGWVWGFWAVSRPLAWVGLALPFAGDGRVLAGQFLLLRRYGGASQPAVKLLRAWWGELRCGVPVFFWRQPFRPLAMGDHLPPGSRQRGVVFVHGLVCNRGFWTPWMRRARAMGLPYVAVSLEPVFGSIDDYVATIDAAVSRGHGATGQAPVLVCHSMGGLAARAWLRAAGAADRVARLVTIASPHAGTWLAQLGHGRNARQMQLGSRWLAQLAADEAQLPRVPFVCWYSDCDNVVFPVATATLAHADNRLLQGRAHVALAFDDQLVQQTLALVQGP